MKEGCDGALSSQMHAIRRAARVYSHYLQSHFYRQELSCPAPVHAQQGEALHYTLIVWVIEPKERKSCSFFLIF